MKVNGIRTEYISLLSRNEEVNMVVENYFRGTIDDEGVVLGARISTYSHALIEIIGQLGYDFAWLDFEHAGTSPWNGDRFESFTRTAEVADINLLVRLPKPDPALIRKTLDAGIRNILIPRVETAEEVRTAVEAARFRYDGGPGQRGASGGRPNEYGAIENYVNREDNEVCVGVMIEKVEAYENLVEILDVPELGFVFVGPGDLSVQLGHPGDRSHPEVLETISNIEQTVIDSGVPLGGIYTDPAVAREKIELGYQIVRIGGDMSSVTNTLRERIDAVR